MCKRLLQIPLLCIFLLILSACQLMPIEETLPPAPVIHEYEQGEYKLTTVMRGDLTHNTTVSCVYDLARIEKLQFPIGGLYIESILVEEGQKVKTGTLLATLEHEALQQQYDSLQYQLNVQDTKKRHLQESLHLQLDSYNALITKLQSQLSQLENHASEEAQNAVLQFKQQINQLQQQIISSQNSYDANVKPIDDTIYILNLQIEQIEETMLERKVFAGIDGIVTYLMKVEEGQRSVKNQLFITISDTNSAVFTINMDYAEYFPVGTKVSFTCKNKDYVAYVIDPVELGISQNGKEKIYLQLEQPDPSLNSGDTGKITLLLDQRMDVLYVDSDAIHYYAGEPFVYIPADNGLRTMRYVTLGLQLRDVVEITSGLAEGEQVIIG